MNCHKLIITVCLLAAGMSPATATEGNNGVRHYLSLGTSLSVGIQPSETGENFQTADGYADQLHDIIAPEYRKIKLRKLGCPGETTATMIVGGLCNYDEGSQLAQAVEFLRAQKNKVALVTIDMGVNDVLAAGCVDTAANDVDVVCLMQAFETVSQNLLFILSTLQQAAHPDTQIVAMNYYNTFLAFWFNGPGGQALALQSAQLANFFNQFVLGNTYAAFGIPVADVAAAFDSDNFGDSGVPGVPQNVLNICALTWMCVPPPVGPNIHANPNGYAVIAATLASTL